MSYRAIKKRQNLDIDIFHCVLCIEKHIGWGFKCTDMPYSPNVKFLKIKSNFHYFYPVEANKFWANPINGITDIRIVNYPFWASLYVSVAVVVVGDGTAYIINIYLIIYAVVTVTLCIVAKRCVLEQKLLLAAYRKSYYEKSIGTKSNDLDLCLGVV